MGGLMQLCAMGIQDIGMQNYVEPTPEMARKTRIKRALRRKNKKIRCFNDDMEWIKERIVNPTMRKRLESSLVVQNCGRTLTLRTRTRNYNRGPGVHILSRRIIGHRDYKYHGKWQKRRRTLDTSLNRLYKKGNCLLGLKAIEKMFEGPMDAARRADIEYMRDAYALNPCLSRAIKIQFAIYKMEAEYDHDREFHLEKFREHVKNIAGIYHLSKIRPQHCRCFPMEFIFREAAIFAKQLNHMEFIFREAAIFAKQLNHKN